MPRANVALVEGVYDAFRRRDLPAVFAILADDVELAQSTEVPWGGTYRGHEGAGRFFQTLGAHVTSALTLERFIDAGDQVVAIGWTRGTVNATGAPFDVPIAHVWEIRDRRVVAVRFCIDNPTMVAALAAGAKG